MITIGLIFFGLLFINSNLLKIFLDKSTSYNNSLIHNEKGFVFLLFIFFGFTLLPFTKKVKYFRKISYIKRQIKYAESFNYTPLLGKDILTKEEVKNHKRYIKLQLLKSNKFNRTIIKVI
ncbi:MAG: hypothetical protein ACOCVF_03175 [bacterium]